MKYVHVLLLGRSFVTQTYIYFEKVKPTVRLLERIRCALIRTNTVYKLSFPLPKDAPCED